MIILSCHLKATVFFLKMQHVRHIFQKKKKIQTKYKICGRRDVDDALFSVHKNIFSKKFYCDKIDQNCQQKIWTSEKMFFRQFQLLFIWNSPNFNVPAYLYRCMPDYTRDNCFHQKSSFHAFNPLTYSKYYSIFWKL